MRVTNLLPPTGVGYAGQAMMWSRWLAASESLLLLAAVFAAAWYWFSPGLVLSAERASTDGYTVRLRADIRSGPDNHFGLYCREAKWSFGDGTHASELGMCRAWRPSAKIARHFKTTHSYGSPGTYRVTFETGPLKGKLTVKVPLVGPVSGDEELMRSIRAPTGEVFAHRPVGESERQVPQ